MKHTKFWVILITVVLVLSIAASAAVLLWNGVGEIACIYQDGTLIEQINLNTVTHPYSFTVTTEQGGANTISVEPGRICISDANCPDHVCVDTGWINNSVVPIVCLPNRLTIQIESETDTGVDISTR